MAIVLRYLGNIRGSEGPRGQQGLRGLDGVNAVSNDNAFAGYVLSPTSNSRKRIEYLYADRPAHLSYSQYMFNLPKYQAALAALAAGTSDVKILCVGDSTTLGEGTSSVIKQRGGYPFKLASIFARHQADSAAGLVVAQVSGSAQTQDTRVVLGTGWARTPNRGFGQAFRGFSGVGGTLTLQETWIDADRWDIYYTTDIQATQGIISASATGGVTVTAPTGGQSAREVRKLTVAAPSAKDSNVLTISNATSAENMPIYIVGIEAYRVSKKRVRISNVGMSGATAADWVRGNADPVTAGTNPLACIAAYQPHLTIIDLGINDATQGRSTADFMADVNMIIAAAQAANSSVVIKTMSPSNRDALTLQASYASALRGLAIPTVDLFRRFGDPLDAYNAGFMADDVHPNDAGYQWIAEYLFYSLPRS